MNLFFLKYFYDTVRLNSVTESAKENHVTQSAISQGISQLESTLGVALLTHKRNAIKITSNGQIVFDWSRKIFRQFEELKSLLSTQDNEYVGTVSFACSHSLASAILPELLERFLIEAPLVKPKVLFGHTGLIKNWIKQADVEFGIVLDNDDLTAFSLQPIYSGEFRFFQSSKRRTDQEITSCIFAPPRAEIHQIKQAFLEKYGYELKTEMELCSWEVIAKLISLTEHVGFIPDYLVLCEERRGAIEPAPIDLFIPYSLFAAYPLGEELSRNAKLFLEIAKKTFLEKKLVAR